MAHSFPRSIRAALLGAGALCMSGHGAVADQVIADDLIVTFSACIGNDCANGESFGFDTLRLKENNTRIKFDDTSASGSFPFNDWQLTANESDNGGLNKFSLDDITNGRTPFTVEASAQSNALYVDDSGHVGFGTSAPVVDLHAVSGNSPTLRLAQDGSDGFTSQIWDVAGNEANFFVRDVTNGSRLSFRIRPGAPESSIDIAADGDVGIGTDNPQASLHVRRTDGTVAVLIEDANGTQSSRELLNLTANGRPEILLANTGAGDEWAIGGGTNLIFKAGAIGSTTGAKTKHFQLDGATGNLTITGSITTGGPSCTGGCDAVFDVDYDLPTISEHAEQMFALRHLPNVGPTSADQPINLSDKVGRVLNELEHAHLYIVELNDRIAHLEAKLAVE